MQLLKNFITTVIGLSVLLSFVTHGASLDPRYASAVCVAPNDKLIIECDYRHSAALNIQSITARVDKTPVQIPKDGISSYPTGDQTTAILFLVDTSDPTRKKTVERRYVRKPSHKIGISAFDTDIKELAPIGSDDADTLNALVKIKAEGQATEFYKSVLDAIVVLKNVNATRKGLVILSDGKDEDRAYKSSDVVSAAKEAGVVILGLGYSERPADAPYLQNLKRLADDTYGQFFNLSDQKRQTDFFKNPYGFIEGGGTIVISSSEFHGRQNVTLSLGMGDDKSIDVEAPVDIPDTRTFFQKVRDFILSYWLFIAASLVLLALLIYVAYRLHDKKKLEKPIIIEYAYLVEPSGLEQKYSMSKTAIRIGRSKDNDICLSNDSISTHHAEIHRVRDGSFYIVDLGSTNGLLVNDKKITQHVLLSGDIVELGEVRLKFLIN